MTTQKKASGVGDYYFVTGTGAGTAADPFIETSGATLSGAVDTELTTADLDTGAGTDTRAVVGLVLAESGGGLLVGSANPLPIRRTSITTATLSNVASSVSNVTLLAANTSRRMAMFINDSTAYLYLKFGATATTSSFTIKLYPDDYYEIPEPVYTGIIDGIWSAANGSVRVTELT